MTTNLESHIMSNAQKVSDERLRELIALPDNAIPANEARLAFRELQSLRAAPTPDAHSEVGVNAGAWEFDRYVNGKLMAEGVTIKSASNFEEAARKATQIAARGPNRETPVLVLCSNAGAVKAEPVAITDEMVERAAKAMEPMTFCEEFTATDEWYDLEQEGRHQAPGRARAALTAALASKPEGER